MRPSWLEFLNLSPKVNPVFSSSASAQLRHKKVTLRTFRPACQNRRAVREGAHTGWIECVAQPEQERVVAGAQVSEEQEKDIEANYGATEDTNPPAPNTSNPVAAPAGGSSPGSVFKGAGDEITEMLGASVMSGNLRLAAVTRGNKWTCGGRRAGADTWAVLTLDDFSLGSGPSLFLKDVVAVSCCEGSCHLVVHAYPTANRPCWAPSPLPCTKRVQTNLRLIAPSPATAWQWVAAFARLKCYINMNESSKQIWPLDREGAKLADALDLEVGRGGLPSFPLPPRPVMAVVLNPRSGHGKAVRIFRRKVLPILELAGFDLTVMETNAPKHAVQIAAQLDLATCPDGIICVGGDGIVNEVLNGLYQRPDAAQALAVPLGVVPAGSDNSLVWSVLGIADPVSAALAIVKGGTVEADSLLLQWEESGVQCVGHTIAYFGFMSDVLKLSQKYHKACGPLRYLVAGFLRLVCLPSFDFDVHYLPVPETECGGGRGRGEASEGESSGREERVDPLSKAMRGLGRVAGKQSPPASPLLSGEEEVGTPHSTPSPRARPRSKARVGGKQRGWVPLGGSPERDPVWGGTGGSRLGQGGSFGLTRSLSDGSDLDRHGGGGGEWGVEATDRGGDAAAEGEGGAGPGEGSTRLGEEGSKWVVRRGPYFAIMACNHSCSSVQCLETQQLAPTASHEDGGLGLLLVRPVGRLQIIQFLLMMQFGTHIHLPFVEYVKVLAVRVVPRSTTSPCCGVDGELWPMEEAVLAGVMPARCRFIGHLRAKAS